MCNEVQAPSEGNETTQFTHGRCIHGNCLNHVPKMEKIGESRLVPAPIMTFWKTWLSTRCCGAPMLRMKRIRTMQCALCGRTEVDVENHSLAVCECCGRVEDNACYYY